MKLFFSIVWLYLESKICPKPRPALALQRFVKRKWVITDDDLYDTDDESERVEIEQALSQANDELVDEDEIITKSLDEIDRWDGSKRFSF